MHDTRMSDADVILWRLAVELALLVTWTTRRAAALQSEARQGWEESSMEQRGRRRGGWEEEHKQKFNFHP
mgnify:CR=1 FL=1